MAETWRVVLRDGSVREVVVYRDDSPSRYSVSTHPWCAGGMRSRTPNGAVTSAMSLGDNPVAEILAPGEPTRAELVAQLAAVTRERDVFRAQQAPLLDAHDALVAAARAAGWTGAGATGAELVAWVRRGEREACAARCDAIYTARDDAARRRRTHGSRDTRDEDCVRLAGQAQGAAMCAEALREGGE